MSDGVFDNRWRTELPGEADGGRVPRELSGAWAGVAPETVPAPRLLAWSRPLARQLGLSPEVLGEDVFTGVFAGNRLLPGMQPWAANYGGHQFGHWAGQLGDGRAISLGEWVVGGARWELQLKGAGRTPFSRRADGRAVLRSSLREFVCSEAMFHLGIPTTRALSLVGTGTEVVRDMFYDGHPEAEPGAIVCRAAPSFVRFGSFELPASRADTSLLGRMLELTVARDFPGHAIDTEAGRVAWFDDVARRTANLVAAWMGVGFVHGVLNTDNMSILGLSIDYGPFGWVEAFDPDFTPNTTDAGHRRYRFGAQPEIAWWNLSRLAAALAPVFGDRGTLEDGLQSFPAHFADAQQRTMAAKLGLSAEHPDTVAHAQALFGLMRSSRADMSLVFRRLARVDPGSPDLAQLGEVFHGPEPDGALARAWNDWLRRLADLWRDADEPDSTRCARMDAHNPFLLPRNWVLQEAIEAASRGDLTPLETLMRAIERPYDEHPDLARWAGMPPAWASQRPGCAMLSCSS